MPETRTQIGAVLFSLLAVGAVATGAAGAAVGTASETGSATSDDVTLEVLVVDQGGDPLGGADISATWDDGDGGPQNATTAGNGRAFVDVPEGATVRLTVDRQFYVRNRPYVVENASAGEVEIDMARQGQATITVRDGGGAVDDAIVRMFQDGQPVVNGRTGPDGTFTTDDLEQDDYTLITFKEGYARNRTTLTVDGTVQQTMGIQQDSVLVTFRVDDDHFEPAQPVQDANVTISGLADVTTQGNGRVTVSVPVNDEYDVAITKPGYDTNSVELDVDESQTSVNATIQRVPAVEARTGVQRAVVGEPVTVTVTDEYGERIPGATVRLDGETVGETDAQGLIEVPIDDAGNHTIEVESGDLSTTAQVEGVEPAPDETPTATSAGTAVTTTGPEPTSGIGPGFGVTAGLVALLALAGLVGRRRR